MKRLLTALALLSLSVGALKAQLTEVIIDIHGNFSVIVKVGPETYAEVSEYGELLDLYGKRPREDYYFGNRHRYRPEDFNDVSIEYYDNFWDYKAGKVATIGSVHFDYHDDFWGYRSGKMAAIGNVRIDYHNDFWDYKAGKVSTIGTSIRFDYHDDFWEEKSGLLASVNNHRYDYSFPSVRPHPRHHGHFNGPAMKGPREVTAGGVTVIVVNRL